MSDSEGEIQIIASEQNLQGIKKNKKFQDSEKFLGDSLIASVEVAEMHALSKRVYQEQPDDDADLNRQTCPCCGVPVNGNLLGLCCKPEELLGLGSSFPMIFKLNRYSIVALVFVSIAACIPCLIDNIVQGDDKWTHERSFNLLTPATYGHDMNVSIWQPFLHIIVCGCLVFFYVVIIGKIKQQSIDLDTFTTTPSDFTLIVRGLPSYYTEEELKNHFEEHFGLEKEEVVTLVPTYDTAEYMEVVQLLNDWKFQYSLVTSYNQKHNKPLIITKCCCFKTELEDSDGCKTSIQELEAKKKELYEQMKTDKMTSTAFITFSSQIRAREIADVISRSNVQIVFDKLFPCCRNARHNFKDSYIYAEMAPDHSDINWENLAVSFSKKVLRRSVVVFAALFVIGIACAIMAGTAVWKVRVNENKDNESADSIRAATIIPSIITVIVNFAVARLVRVLSAYGKHSTWTDFNRSVLNLLIGFILLNNIGIPIFIYIALDQDWFSFGGLAYTVFWLEIMNAIASPMIYLLGPKNLAKKLQQYSYRRKEIAETLNVSQKQANMVFEGPELDLPDRFANIIKNFSLSLFYAPIVPIGVLIAIFGLVFEMMAFKLMLLRYHTRPRNYNSDLVVQAASWLRWGLLLYSLGIFVFYQKLVEELFYLELFFFVAMCGYTLTPISALCNCCFKDKTLDNIRKLYEKTDKNDKNCKEDKNNNYLEILHKFHSDYERENPVTRAKGLENYAKFLQELKTKNRSNEKSNEVDEERDPGLENNFGPGGEMLNDPRYSSSVPQMNYTLAPGNYPNIPEYNPNLSDKNYNPYSSYPENNAESGYNQYPNYPQINPVEGYNPNPGYNQDGQYY